MVVTFTELHASVTTWTMAPGGAARGRSERSALIVELVTATGERFRGEAAPLPGMSRDSLDDARRVVRAFAQFLPFGVEATMQGLVELVGAVPAQSPSARFALETAVMRALGITAPPPPRVAHVVDTPDEARAAIAAGAAALKLKVGEPFDIESVRSIARAAPGVPLRLDANQAWPRERVDEYLALLAGLPIEFVEEPCADTVELLATKRAVPLALDESIVALSLRRDLDLLAMPGLGVLVLKPTLLGGALACLGLAQRARARGIGVVITHALEGPIGTEAVRLVASLVDSPLAAGVADHPALAGYRGVRARVVAAERTPETLDAIRAALDAEAPIALVPPGRAAADEEPEVPPGTAAVLFTSGSTGEPRGVVISRRAIDSAIDANAAHLGWQDGDRWLLALSTAHAGGLAVVARCHAAKVPVELVREGDSLAAALARCTLASLVPTQLAALLEDPTWRPSPKLRAILLGGAAASPALLARAAARGVPFLRTYGMTETFGQIATATPDRAGDPDAPLVPLRGVSILAGTEAEPAPIQITAPMLATGYLGGPRFTPPFTTNDLGYFDEHGSLVVVGRVDDIIVTGGENVHPLAVEAVLTKLPGISAALVFGVPDERWGQLVAAALVVTEDFELARATADWRAVLPSSSRPREVALVRSLPLNANGKPDRRAAAGLPRVTVPAG